MRKWQEMTQLVELSYSIRFTKELGYLDTKTYKESDTSGKAGGLMCEPLKAVGAWR
jgi:hypothetical protein